MLRLETITKIRHGNRRESFRGQEIQTEKFSPRNVIVAGRSEAAAPAGMPGVCAQGCMGAGMQVDPWAAYLQQQRFLQQQAYGQTVGHRVFDGNQIPVPQSPSQTTNGSSSQNLWCTKVFREDQWVRCRRHLV